LITVLITEDFQSIEPSFKTIFMFSEGGLFTNMFPKYIPASVRLNGNEISTNVIAFESDDGSTINYNKNVAFAKNNELKIQIDNLIIPVKNYKNLRVMVALMKTTDDIILVKRLYIPFHWDSGVWSNTNKTVVTTRFISASGYQPISYLEFEYPKCVGIPDILEERSCISIPWFIPIRGIAEHFICRAQNNSIFIKNMNNGYPDTNSTAIEFGIGLQKPHNCQDNEIITGNVREGFKNKEIEKAVMMGINKGPLSSIIQPDEIKGAQIYTVSYGVKRYVNLLLIALLMLIIC